MAPCESVRLRTSSRVMPIHTARPVGRKLTISRHGCPRPSKHRNLPHSQNDRYPRPDVLQEVWPVLERHTVSTVDGASGAFWQRKGRALTRLVIPNSAPDGKLLRPSSTAMAFALHLGNPASQTGGPDGQHRAMKSGRGRPTYSVSVCQHGQLSCASFA